MQISNSTLSQYVANTLNRYQQTDRSSVKPVTIEGQIVKDDDEKKQARQSGTATESDSSGSFVQDLENGTQQQLILPAAAPGNINDSLLIQQEFYGSSGLLGQSEQSFQPTNSFQPANSFQPTQDFPFGSRRSFNGLSGGSLVIQNYLNNEPQAPVSGYSSRIDFFI